MKVSRLGRIGAMVLFAAGCGTARYVQKTPTGGTLVLEGDPTRAKSQAEHLMVIHCAGGYRIVSDAKTIGDTEAERLQTTKLSYVCRSGPPKPSPPLAVPPDAGAPAAN
jgi:hypothetical protein